MAALISVPIWVYLGYFGAYNREWLLTWVSRGQTSVLVLLGLAAIVLVVLWVRRRQSARRCS
jgi:membrane protein DedA with SNARE-associated domain